MGNDVIEKIRRFFDKNLYFLLKNREIRMYSFLPLDIERNIENSFLKTVNLQKNLSGRVYSEENMVVRDCEVNQTVV